MAEKNKKRDGVLSLNDRHYRLLQGLSSAKPAPSTAFNKKLPPLAHHDAPHFSLDSDSPPPPPQQQHSDEKTFLDKKLPPFDHDDAPHFSLDSDSPPPQQHSVLEDVLVEDEPEVGTKDKGFAVAPSAFHRTDDNTLLVNSDDQVLSTNLEEEEYTEEEKKPEKVKVQGRRRLCKVSSMDTNSHDNYQLRNLTPTNVANLADFDSPSPSRKEKDTGDVGDIRDILNDLSSRLDLLSIERKPAPRNGDLKKVPLPFVADENVDLLSSSSCSFSAVSDPSSDASYQSAREDELVSKFNNLREEHNVETEEVVKKELPTRRTFFATFEDLDDEDDECMILGEDKMVKRFEGTRGKYQDKFYNSDKVDVLDVYSDDEVSEDETSIILSGPTSKYVLPGKIATMLFPHQRDGLKWLWSLHTQGKGGILGDDMGLGKTMQMCGFLAGMFHSCLIKRALIVAPKTLLPHWIKELSAVGLSEKTREYFGTCTKTRQYELQSVLQDKGVLLTTYDIVRNNTKSLRGDQYAEDDDDIMWDYMILDEGHLIKNPGTQRAKSLLEIPSAHRIIISGTPIQNNLKELWALFNFCCPELLGDKNWFKKKYESPILRGNDKGASDREKRIGSAVAKELREHIQPYFLRRLKSDVFNDDDSKEAAKLSKKNEIIVWLKLTRTQRQLYEAFLKSELVLSAFDGSPLAALTILKKICDHPLLLTKRAAEDILEGMDTMLNPEEKIDAEKLAMHIADMTERSDFEENHDNVSCKISFILSLLDHLIPAGHCTLIFSQTRKMLNLIQDSLVSRGYKFLRIDGTTKACDRVQVVNDFQEGVGAPIFLLTSQVGGLGLTLTKADRVIVVDPAWNPSTDNQSVDRAYRIGQKKDVVVYRLMTCGTIEEKIYRKQIYKGGLFKTATEHKEQTRYFSQQDLQELFSLPKLGFDVSPTQQQLLEEHDSQHTMSEFLRDHVQFLETLGIAGVSQHSLLFSKTAPVPKVQDDEVVTSKNETKFMGYSSSTSRIELDVDGAKYAFNPKDVKLNKRSPSKDGKHKRTEFEVNDRIVRLNKLLADKVLVSRLPDNGGNLRKQLAEMKTELDILQKARKSENDVICLDDISEDFQRVLNV